MLEEERGGERRGEEARSGVVEWKEGGRQGTYVGCLRQGGTETQGGAGEGR